MKNTAHFAFWPNRLPYELELPQVPLFEFLETSARRYPDNPAIIYYGRPITYRHMMDAVERTASMLSDTGVAKGDRVALYMQNTPHFAIGYFGILRANAVVVPVNPMLTERELLQILADSGTKTVITTADIHQRVLAVKPDSAVQEVIVGKYADYLPEDPELPVPEAMRQEPDIEAQDGLRPWLVSLQDAGAPPSVEVGVSDMAMLPYTSGSTGVPKGCIHTHATVISNTVSSALWMTMLANSTILCTLPLFHVTGLVHSLLAPIYAGSAIAMLTRWDREAAISAIEKYKCTHWTNITTMVIDILNHPEIRNRDVNSLITIGGGGAPLPEAVGKKLTELTGLEYVEGYGMTETISQTHFNPPDRPKLQCIGIPDFGVDARIIDLDTLAELGTDQQGELVINGPEVMAGYWNRPDDNREVFIEIDGKQFLRTGDICTMDDEGYFYIVDRSKRMINAAGYKVWPTEVEGVLYGHPAVSEVCVVGVPDPVRVENVKAFIVLSDDSKGKITEKEIIEWAKQNMAAYRYPRLVEFVESLPKSGTGKIQWRQLQQQEKEKAEGKGK
ncbi:MAG: AMP-binding protein [Desulfobacterales bacterium]|nr:AMP-binding protein [Desulfobacterales bacterium]